MSKTTHLSNIIGVKELRQNMDKYARAVQTGRTFTVVKRSRPIFTIQKPQELDEWGDPVGYFNNELDLRDENGEGMPIEEFEAILKKVIAKKDTKHERQNAKVSR